MGAFVTVFRKELVDALRDRRSLVSALVFALFGPLVIGLALGSMARRVADDRSLVVRSSVPEDAARLTAFLEARSAIVEPAIDASAVEAAVRAGEAEVGLVVAGSFATDLAAFESPRVTVFWDDARRSSRRDRERLQTLLDAWTGTVTGARLLARGVAPAAVAVARIEPRNLSTPSSRAATALAMVPIFLLMATFIGGMAAAIDVTAGERERGSLEALLLSPAARSTMAGGKWLAASTLNSIVVAATLATAVLVVRSPRLDALGLRFGDDPAVLVAILAVLSPLALLGPAVQMLSAMFSRSFKEAQTYVSLLTMVPALPGFLFAFRDVEVAGWMRYTPILGHQVAVDALLRGEQPALAVSLALAATTVTAAFVCVASVARLLRRERLVVLS